MGGTSQGNGTTPIIPGKGRPVAAEADLRGNTTFRARNAEGADSGRTAGTP